MKHFKKVSPQITLQMSSGGGIRFENVDGEWGIYRTANPGIIAELEAAIRNEIGGVFAISEAEYNELAQKKTTSRPRWRDELGKNGSASRQPLTSQRPDPQSVAVSVEHGFQPPPADRVTPTAQQPPAFRPNAIPRTKVN